MREANGTSAAFEHPGWDYVKVVGVISIVTCGGWFSALSYLALGYIFLLAVIALSTRVRRLPALSGAVLSSVAWNYFFVPPRLSFSVLHFDETLLLITYFVVALIGSQLTSLRSAADRAELLAESERLHQTLFNSVSHELKTPIAVLHTAVEQLGTDDSAKRERIAGEMRIAVERLDAVVGNLLNQTRLESEVLRPRLDWCSGRELVAAARRAVGRRLDEHPVTVDIPPDFPIFLADAVLMEQSIANLLLNAAIHTPPGSGVLVGASVGRGSKDILISVTDEGPGISAGRREKIFEKFSRGPEAHMGGLGLGLSIVRGFMNAQGGNVYVESPPEGGARFTLTLPLTSHEGIPAE